MTTIVLDLDYTLLDTAAFKEALVSALVDCGASRASLDRTYSDVVTRPGVTYDYDPDLQLELLGGELKCGREEATRRLNDVVNRCGEFLYPGAEGFLKRLKSRGAELVLLTLGNPSWQKRKIDGSGLAGLFDRIVAADSPKSDIIGTLATRIDRTFVVNDNGEEIRQMMAAAPGLGYIMKRGPKPSPPDLVVPVAESFEEIEDIIFSA